jgi:AbrB family looped-hinge helix DNA binding protein
MQSTIDAAGRMVIPKPIRDAAGLKPGESLEVNYRDGRIEIEPAADQVKLVRKGRFLVARAEGAPRMTVQDVNRIVEEVRRRGL